jgi:tRNA(Ile2) C34 agmatinyltransferase TiaS
VGTQVGMYGRWALYQLAFDEATYGARAGQYVIVTEDGEDEIDVMGTFKDVSAAQVIVDRHNRIVERCEKIPAPKKVVASNRIVAVCPDCGEEVERAGWTCGKCKDDGED